MAGYNSERTPNVRVTVLEDPNNSLQELFNPVSQRQQVPLHQRNLPRSFFVPPVGINDSTHLTDPNTTDLVISHSKANSSPACLDAPLCTSLDTIIPSHTHQKSLEVSAEYSQGYCHETGLSDVAKCLNHVTRDLQSSPYGCGPTLSYALSKLPAWYELTLNENNQVYFLNHQTKETTWFDPRIPEEHQKWGMTLDELQQVHINYARHLCENAPSMNIYRPQMEPSVSLPSANSTTTPSISNVRVPAGLVNASSPLSKQVISPTSTHSTGINRSALGMFCPTSPAPPPSSGQSVGSSAVGARLRIAAGGSQSGQQSAHPPRTHPPKPHVSHPIHNNPNTMTSNTANSSNSGGGNNNSNNTNGNNTQTADTTTPHPDVVHHRQHSHGTPVPSQHVTQTSANLLGTHLRSCSQPVSMSIGHDGVNPNGLGSVKLPNSSRLGDPHHHPLHHHLGSLSGTVCGLSASSSLIGLSASPSVGGGAIIGSLQTPAQLSSTTTSSSSGQLIQGLECLRLNTSTSPASALATPPHMLESQQQKHLQQPQYMIPMNSLSPSVPSTGMRFTGTALPPTSITATQHSHQGSMDSGVGQSLTGNSIASANQTPEHTVMLFCDPSLSECNTEHMEGISYPNEELGCTPLTMFDNIDISDISA
ncbi:hypothetical protein P879_02244 [Paragonimus westermani]|uniref:WW domain-containing protein n=1 Tax=Paragonimus westermani TaxID=34504 RepID=A0A8T0DJQ9_9TREM|nr:hypothetical protein P879_02244 [Paragonimus westermani]